MHITQIELEDIKSHAYFKGNFERGTTAIMGENGAGKSTLIEAIAWTLFDLLDYKKENFVRRGAKKGVVNVTFESSLDERKYRVYRDSKTGYYIYDLKLKTRIAEKKDEVTRFLRQHLGVEVGTDLEALFRNAIGVPQGTFTADFLKSPSLRKPIFDKLLKVEEYQQGAAQLLETANFIKAKQIEIGKKISFAEGKLENFERIEEEFIEVQESVKTLKISLENLEKEVAEKKKIVEGFDKQEGKVNELKTAFEKLSNERSRAEVVLAQKEKDKNAAEKASLKIKEVEEDHKIHINALGRLKELDRERGERDKLNTAITKIKEAITNVKAEEKSAKDDLEKITNAHKAIENLTPKVQTQHDLEAKQKQLGNEIAKAGEIKDSIERLEEKIKNLQNKYKANQEKINHAEANKEKAELFEKSIKRDEEIKNELATFRAKLDSERNFQAEIKNGLCPILSEKCLNLKDDETLEDYVSKQFTNVESKIGALEIEQKDVAVVVQSSRKAEQEAATLPAFLKRKEEITDEGKSLRAEQDQLNKKLENLPNTEKELTEINKQLKDLGSPRENIKLLRKELDREISVQEKITNIESNFERLESDRRFKVEQLETYKDLDSNLKEFNAKRDETANAHKEFIINETLAKTLSEKLTELEHTQKEITELTKKFEHSEKEYQTEKDNYDKEKHFGEKSKLQEIERDLALTKSNLGHADKKESELKEDIRGLKAIKFKMSDDLNEKIRLEKVGEATAFIRSTLKDAAPRVAKNYVYHVSMEANLMFRDISGNAERTLRWTDDYDIVLEENGYERPFQNLSGGEQMVAALSVRLALLKQLSDVRLAFFDEPTMNMDETRRERLAEQISGITEKQTFDQLFVISHDDTFENYVDNVMTIRPDDEEE